MESFSYITFYNGYPTLEHKLPNHPCTKLDVAERSWEKMYAFDASHQYKRCLDDPPMVGRISRLATRLIFEVTGYNPTAPYQPEWRVVGPYTKEDVTTQLERGLKTDDDIITQFFDGDDVLKLAEAAQDFSEMVLAIECIQGACESEDQARNYAERVVGRAES